jgi:hypothetical protein
MGKRSSFERKARDFYPTPYEALLPLLPYINNITRYCEPCAGDGQLIASLTKNGYLCASSYDIEPQNSSIKTKDACNLTKDDLCGADVIITNPPWDRSIMHNIIKHCMTLIPSWFLFDADWMHTKQSSELMQHCQKIVSVGRVKWIPNSKMTGKDNCCWYLFDINKRNKMSFFIGRT